MNNIARHARVGYVRMRDIIGQKTMRISLGILMAILSLPVRLCAFAFLLGMLIGSFIIELTVLIYEYINGEWHPYCFGESDKCIGLLLFCLTWPWKLE